SRLLPDIRRHNTGDWGMSWLLRSTLRQERWVSHRLLMLSSNLRVHLPRFPKTFLLHLSRPIRCMERAFNIVSLFLQQAQNLPDKTAIVEKGGRSISFGELSRQVEETAAYFAQRGIERGDRVLVFVPMGIDLYRTILALFYRGATAVFVDEWADSKRLDTCCAIADCKAFIGVWKAHLLRLLSKEIRRIPIKLTTTYSPQDYVSMTETFSGDTALITFTTGSPGTP